MQRTPAAANILSLVFRPRTDLPMGRLALDRTPCLVDPFARSDGSIQELRYVHVADHELLVQ